MSYVYILVKPKDKSISRFKEVDWDTIDNWQHTMEEVRQKLTDLYPTTQWEWYENTIRGEKHMQLLGDVFDLDGRFGFNISEHPATVLSIGGSHHVDQREEVIKIAESLCLAAFDAQTGERLH